MSLSLIINHEGLAIAGAILVPHIGGLINGAYLAKQNVGWYHALQRSDSIDDKALDHGYLPIYAILYGCIGYASYRIWEEVQTCAAQKYEDTKLGSIALTSYVAGQVVLQHTWTAMFWGKHDLGLSLGLITIIDLMAIGNTYLFYTLDETAGYLMAPYALWMCYVGTLNYIFWDKNGGNQPLTLYGDAGSPPPAAAR